MSRLRHGAIALAIAAATFIAPGGAYATADGETDPSPSSDPTVTAAGDIADSGGGDSTTAALINSLAPTKALTLGDNAYPDGTSSDYANWYEPTWGLFKSKTAPAPGNHDYHTAGAAGYFGYFGPLAGPSGRGYYSYDLGSWHLVSLNSEVAHGPGSAQDMWLKNDLAASTASCTLAYWHKPRWTSGAYHGGDTTMGPILQALYDARADVVLAGHNHQYERFAPQNPSGARDDEFGLRSFVVGTGGAPRYRFGTIQPNSEVRDNSTWGVLQLTLHSDSYDWSFKPSQASSFTDNGTANCHGKPNPSPPDARYKFADEFNGAAGTAPDSTKWSVFGGSNPPDWGIECFVNDRQHIAMDGAGNLVLTGTAARSTPCTDDVDSTGVLSGGMETGPRSRPKFKWAYGVEEARVALECQQGSWPAVWNSGGTAGVSWPTDGEIDLMEGTSRQTSMSINQGIWMPKGTGSGQLHTVTAGQWCNTGYHVWKVRWEPGRISFYIDGAEIKSWTPADARAAGLTWPFDTSGYAQRPIITLQMGGAVGRVDRNTLPVTMKVDYIRIANL
jgi:Glycosyl hydrolases family 16/Calcineurin-like phosphoesterase